MLVETVESTDIYLEIGQKKTCAVALEWPGWCRFGKNEGLAIQALLEYGPRYTKIAQVAGLAFQVPESIASFNVTDRLQGNATTDFGAPDKQLGNDWRPIEDQELQRIQKILSACWLAFDESVAMGEGKELQKGLRGGGRELTQIVEHVLGAEESYLKALGWKLKATKPKDETINQRKLRVRDEVLRGLEGAAAGQLPRKGPRDGRRWPPRFFVRRLAWHVVDHTWEIEDRIIR